MPVWNKTGKSYISKYMHAGKATMPNSSKQETEEYHFQTKMKV